MAVKMGASVVGDITASTHVVVTKMKRTSKLMCALALGKFMVSPKWITSSVKRGSWNSPDTCILKDSKFEKQFGMSLSESLRISRARQFAGEGGVLCGKSIFASLQIKLPRDDLKNMIESSGGKLLGAMPAEFSDSVICIACKEDLSVAKELRSVGYEVHVVEIILSAIMNQKIDYSHTLDS